MSNLKPPRTMAIRHDTATPAVSRPQASELETKLHTLDELLKSRAFVLGDSTLFGCPATGVDDFEEHGARDVDKYVDAAVAKLRDLGLSPVVCPAI